MKQNGKSRYLRDSRMSDGGRSGAESWDMSSTNEKAPKPLGFLSNP